jgi:hypothetical protein
VQRGFLVRVQCDWLRGADRLERCDDAGSRMHRSEPFEEFVAGRPGDFDVAAREGDGDPVEPLRHDQESTE